VGLSFYCRFEICFIYCEKMTPNRVSRLESIIYMPFCTLHGLEFRAHFLQIVLGIKKMFSNNDSISNTFINNPKIDLF